MRLSIIIPVLNEAERIAATLQALAGLREQGAQVIVVDGGSTDSSVSLAGPLSDLVVMAGRGRALQMNAGAVAASGDVLLFLHADTILPPQADRLVLEGLRDSVRRWGRFDVSIDGRSRLLRLVALMMNLRSRLTGIATGDQGIFVRRDEFMAVGGFPVQPLMEDIALSRLLKARSRPLCLRARASTSGRRWEQHGVWRTIFLMWRLRLRYWLGAAPEELARQYR